jgi:hypothetical protein
MSFKFSKGRWGTAIVLTSRPDNQHKSMQTGTTYQTIHHASHESAHDCITQPCSNWSSELNISYGQQNSRGYGLTASADPDPKNRPVPIVPAIAIMDTTRGFYMSALKKI